MYMNREGRLVIKSFSVYDQGSYILRKHPIYMNRAGSLVIQSFSAADQGSYICKASSEVANLMSREAVLTLAGRIDVENIYSKNFKRR